jgi:hypothetical protein
MTGPGLTAGDFHVPDGDRYAVTVAPAIEPGSAYWLFVYVYV